MSRSTLFLATAAIIAALLLLIPDSTLALNPTYDLDIEPGKYKEMPIPGTSKISVDIKITSDIPIDMYVMTQEQTAVLHSNMTTPTYEELYTGVTSETFKYENKEGGMRWVVIKNEDPIQTANVTVEFKVLEEVGERIGNACCGSTLLVGITILIGVVAILYILKRR